MPDSEPTLLILGGTAEARTVAAALADAPIHVMSSLAGRTADARLPEGDVRVGGFGGVAGMAETLRRERVAAVIDATHPFAARISANAVAACAQAGVPRLALVRPAWRRRPGDRWTVVPDMASAARAAARLGARPFVTVGAQELAPFRRFKGRMVVRVVDGPVALPRATVVRARGPFTVACERTLMRRHRVDVLVTKASGGGATAAKLDAARTLRLPVVLVRRPPPPPGPRVADVGAAVAWACATLGLDPGAAPSLTDAPPTSEPRMIRLASLLLVAALWLPGPAVAQIDLLATDPLLAAAYEGDTRRTRELLARGKSANVVDGDRRTALMWASIEGHVETVEIILRYRVRIDQEDRLGNTALYYAADRDRLAVVEVLVAAGATVDAENREGRTPLMTAAEKGFEVVVETLIAAGADVNHADYTGRTVLEWARESRSRRVARMLEQAGAQ